MKTWLRRGCATLLVAVGTRQLDASAVGALMRGTGELPAQLTAPASGLFLEAVLYPGETFDDGQGGLVRIS